MVMSKILGLFLFVPATMFLTVSFFVLVVLRKVEEKGLKNFGYLVVTLLWIGSAILFALGLYKATTGKTLLHPMWTCRMHEMMSMPCCSQAGKMMMKH